MTSMNMFLSIYNSNNQFGCLNYLVAGVRNGLGMGTSLEMYSIYG